MFIFTMSVRARPYFASRRPSKMSSVKVFEQRRPMLSTKRRAGLRAPRAAIIGGVEDWQPMPTRASRSWPASTASKYARVFALYV